MYVRHLLLAKSMPKSVKIRSSKKNAEMGITSLSINAVDDSIFYIGAESGGLFKCSFTDRSAPIGKHSLLTMESSPLAHRLFIESI